MKRWVVAALLALVVASAGCSAKDDPGSNDGSTMLETELVLVLGRPLVCVRLYLDGLSCDWETWREGR